MFDEATYENVVEADESLRGGTLRQRVAVVEDQSRDVDDIEWNDHLDRILIVDPMELEAGHKPTVREIIAYMPD